MIAEKVFAEGVAKDIRNYLPPEYEDADFQVVQKNKNNGIQLIGVQVSLPERNASPIIYMEQFFDEIRQGEPVERVMNRIASCIEKSSRAPFMNSGIDLTNYDSLKEHLAIKLVNTQANRKMLQEMPHENIEDLSAMPDEKGAYFEPEEKCIYVRKGMDAQEIFQSLVSELVFAGYAEGNPDYDRSEDAFHAYCASYMLSKKYGMDISQFDFTHAPEFFENMEPQEVRGELSKARDAANAISGRMAKVLEQDKNLNQRQQGRAENGQKESEAKTGEQKTQEHDRGMAR